MMDFEGKIAVVTGGGRGIGRAIALALAHGGADVAVAARSKAEIETVATDIRKFGRKSLAVQADVSREGDVSRLSDEVLEHFGKVDILVNNAGIGVFAPVAELKVSDFDRMFAVNVRGAFLCTRLFLPGMIKQNSGDIVNIASLAGRNSFKGGAGYSATKWALIGFARSLMLEVREHDIRVITLCPGSVITSFSPDSSHRANADSIPKPEDIARIACDALKMPRHVMVSEIDIRPTNPSG